MKREREIEAKRKQQMRERLAGGIQSIGRPLQSSNKKKLISSAFNAAAAKDKGKQHDECEGGCCEI